VFNTALLGLSSHLRKVRWDWRGILSLVLLGGSWCINWKLFETTQFFLPNWNNI